LSLRSLLKERSIAVRIPPQPAITDMPPASSVQPLNDSSLVEP
jgi:hypothetical protein